MFLTAVLLPCFSGAICAIAGRYLGYRGSRFVTIFSLGVSGTFFFLLLLMHSQTEAQTSLVHLYDWLQIGTLKVSVNFLCDSLSLTMGFVVVFISLVVHIYSTDYLRDDPHLIRFLMHLSFFTFFMLLLISAGNFVQLFFGWEGVGISSYLLINFWFTRIQANKAALKALFLNRIGDLSLLAAISLLVLVFGTVDFAAVSALAPLTVTWMVTNSCSYLDLICFCLLGGAIGKSAQLGLHVWLPDAMEGPTPVSALLHAATMVTAGVFLIIRVSFLFEHSPMALAAMALIGGLTAFFAASTGLFQNDLKRIIAFSTCSQLGYMFFSCGLSAYNIALFHLFNHAFFKALLFLAAGNVIHALLDEQDLRYMGGLSQKLPLTFAFFLIASFALMGFPFLSGFYSKDLMIEVAGTHFIAGHSFIAFLAISSAFFTAAYSYRLLFYVFFSRANFSASQHIAGSLHEPPFHIQVGLIVLAFGSIMSGYLCADVFVGMGSLFFSDSIFVSPCHTTGLAADFLPLWQKNLPLGGFFFAPLLMHFFLRGFDYLSLAPAHFVLRVLRFLNQKWFFDKVYNTSSLRFLRLCYRYVYYVVDKGVVELFGPTGLASFFSQSAPLVAKTQSGNAQDYIARALAVFAICLLFYFFSLVW